ncbi:MULTISPECIES: 3'-5' exonuclease [unclassified Salinivibrio]|uniref:3'-5' exonuclease n=1 Tax=unclassified Salinivibrio TaxID=2636825 RepID=UPI00061453E4|nr:MULTISPECIES: 3'-5' exonuclease [unclassified Salinivibrio]KKA46139.1 DNA polymerase III subunit epsilon [Salinivibrio sp. KP-1]OOE76977.1 3'-5' exonuclease [Salinivibrio sp. ML290]OOE81629.1 3'-5' exonuclease [Salinivibrio sp. ML198]
MLHFDLRKKEDADDVDWRAMLETKRETVQHETLQAFYQQGWVSPDTPVSQVSFVALDFETTGLDSQQDAIVSIGLVPFTLNRIRCQHAQHWIVNPNRPLAESSIVIHGITHSDIVNAPDFSHVIEPLLSALAGSVVVVHYRRIEREFLDRAIKQRLGEGIIFPMVDTMELEARKHRNGKRSFMDWIARRPPESIRLADSRHRYHLPFYQSHHALTDAMATAELLQAQIAHDFSPDTPISELWR